MPYVWIVKILLSPLLLIQGRRARRTALRMPEAAGQRWGWISHNFSDNALNLLFVGDSTMAGVGVAHQEVALGITDGDRSLRSTVSLSALAGHREDWSENQPDSRLDQAGGSAAP